MTRHALLLKALDAVNAVQSQILQNCLHIQADSRHQLCVACYLDSDVIARTVIRSMVERLLILLQLLKPTGLQNAFPWSGSNPVTSIPGVSFDVCSIWEAHIIFWTPQD